VSAGGYVAVLVIDLHFPDAGSLKGKRKELSSIKAQLHGRLGVAVAETDHQDLWQRATLTAALTGGSLARLTTAADTVERWLGARCGDGVRVERMVLSLEELRELPVGGPNLFTRLRRDE
jgi:uncharacterized protein YlxP (DUF503 family)